MIFETKEDIEAPLDHVFGVLSDFQGFERAAMRRGAEVQRLGDFSEMTVGSAWKIGFNLRGKFREVEVELTEMDVPNRLVFENRSDSIGGHLAVDLVALSRRRTRMALEVELKPQNLSARLLAQSLKLAKSNLNKRFQIRIAEFAKDTEDRYQAMS